jgi:hypothetical protein
MGRFADVIRCHILGKYMASYMRERNVDALLVLRNENKWAMTGKCLDIFSILLVYIFVFEFSLLCVIFCGIFCFSR